MRFIGPHVSIRDNIAFAVDRAHELGATGFAIFTKNQRVWSAPPLKADDAELFRKKMEEYGFPSSAVLPHAGYLINPATPDAESREKALNLFEDEARRTLLLGLSVINIHPGAYKEGSIEDGLKRSAAFFDEAVEAVPGIKIAIENTAGAGTIIGSRFEELDAILDAAKEKDSIGFTLDTAHLFGAGYDVKDHIEEILDDFVSRFGKEKLFGMHINDSKVPLASNKDRHESIGAGYIGSEAFVEIVNHKATDGIPLILETPDEDKWKDEIAFLLRL